MGKRVLSLVLALVLCVSMLPVTARSADEDFVINADGVLTEYRGAGGDVTIPNSVTSIGYWAFDGCSSLTSVTIPNSVTSIRSNAFRGCSSLTSVSIPDSVTSIGGSVFEGCSSLTSVSIPDSVTSIGYSAFYGCSSLTSVTIPDSVTYIEWRTFYNCSSLTSVTIPNGVTSIGSHAFYGCSSLTSVTIPDSVTYIGEDAFYGCSNLTRISIPNGVTSIGNYVFYGCSSLTSVTIPNSVTSVGNSAFSGCSSLTSVSIPSSVTSIEDYAFVGCSSLTSVSIPNSVVSIAGCVFSGCSSLTSVIIPDSVTYIGGAAFRGCSSLTSVSIPDSVTYIGDKAFLGCSSLTSVTIPNSVTSIGEDAFVGCSSLTSVSIPNNVTSISFGSFSGCSSLTSVTIPDSVTYIRDTAFSGCSSLTSVSIPNSVVSIAGWYASITTLVTGSSKLGTSYAIMTLLSESEPDSGAAVSATIGEPYYVTVYTDETCTEEVADEQLAEHPLTLTLSYTDEMFDAADAPYDADVLLFWFDSDRNLYVAVDGAVQDRDAMSVTASITKQGEYILAVDTVAPIVTNFRLSDETLTPSMTVLVSDLCGIGELSFWIDDGAPLVTTTTLGDYYDAASNVFSYTFDSPLTEGTHTAYFQAADTLGNRNGEPFSFEFEVYGEHGTITAVNAPMDEITKPEPFTVTVECSADNGFAAVALQPKAGDYTLEAVPMEYIDGVWTAQVTPVSGVDEMQLTAAAGDGKGNTTFSEPVIVRLALPAALDNIAITGGTIRMGAQGTDVTIDLQNAVGMAPSGTLMVAAYRDNGQLMETAATNIALASGEAKSYSVSLSTSYGEIGYAKAFLIDPSSGYIPECSAERIVK